MPSRTLPALAKAAQLAQALDAKLVLFHALATPLYLESDLEQLRDLNGIEQRTQAAARERLENLARRLRRHGIEVSVSAEWDYPVYEAVIRAARRAAADLIVAERHAGRHLAAGFLHLTDWELLRLAPLPVLLVKRGGLYRQPRILAAVDPDVALVSTPALACRPSRPGRLAARTGCKCTLASLATQPSRHSSQ